MSSLENQEERSKIVRKDGIGENETALYLEAAEKYGNNWKSIVSYIVAHGRNVLPTAVFKKYVDAENDKDRMKSIRSRIGNIRRRTKEHPKVSSRERANVIDTSNCNTIQDVALQMQHAQKHEERDPINKPQHDTSSDTDRNEDKDTDCSVSENASKTKKASKTKRKRAKPKRQGKPKEDKMKKLMDEASSMMKVAAKAAATHNKYLRAMAKAKQLDLSSSSSDSD